jgi:hypothetical protein
MFIATYLWFLLLLSSGSAPPLYSSSTQIGVMEPNTKLMFEELMKKIQSMRSEMREGFVVHDATFAACDAELAHSEQQREVRVAGLESTAAEFDKSFNAWKPEVDSSLSSVKCELAKLNAYFDRDTKAPGASAQGVLPGWLASGRSLTGFTADGPTGHRSDNNHRGCGFGRVYTHTHDPIKGTILLTPPPPPNSPTHPASSYVEYQKFPGSATLSTRVTLGQLTKLHFPKFDGENPKLWQSRCELYYEMYVVEQSV